MAQSFDELRNAVKGFDDRGSYTRTQTKDQQLMEIAAYNKRNKTDYTLDQVLKSKPKYKPESERDWTAGEKRAKIADVIKKGSGAHLSPGNFDIWQSKEKYEDFIKSPTFKRRNPKLVKQNFKWHKIPLPKRETSTVNELESSKVRNDIYDKSLGKYRDVDGTIRKYVTDNDGNEFLMVYKPATKIKTTKGEKTKKEKISDFSSIDGGATKKTEPTLSEYEAGLPTSMRQAYISAAAGRDKKYDVGGPDTADYGTNFLGKALSSAVNPLLEEGYKRVTGEVDKKRFDRDIIPQIEKAYGTKIYTGTDRPTIAADELEKAKIESDYLGKVSAAQAANIAAKTKAGGEAQTGVLLDRKSRMLEYETTPEYQKMRKKWSKLNRPKASGGRTVNPLQFYAMKKEIDANKELKVAMGKAGIEVDKLQELFDRGLRTPQDYNAGTQALAAFQNLVQASTPKK